MRIFFQLTNPSTFQNVFFGESALNQRKLFSVEYVCVQNFESKTQTMFHTCYINLIRGNEASKWLDWNYFAWKTVQDQTSESQELARNDEQVKPPCWEKIFIRWSLIRSNYEARLFARHPYLRNLVLLNILSKLIN